eukprot:CAMPEP_0175426080 /NCGR_PEP_ID=MMETSP0095-20121207/49632_1 /TAXON_ID=311494 /ORGANISM="Alexandrium monilatum, Strain CCMP3105" /LENGTH=375 /DNA_ID=CAMNT_0016725435 /DNA_START=84 /DNA_END=1208 /DNA_ORIENTATION=+
MHACMGRAISAEMPNPLQFEMRSPWLDKLRKTRMHAARGGAGPGHSNRDTQSSPLGTMSPRPRQRNSEDVTFGEELDADILPPSHALRVVVDAVRPLQVTLAQLEVCIEPDPVPAVATDGATLDLRVSVEGDPVDSRSCDGAAPQQRQPRSVAARDFDEHGVTIGAGDGAVVQLGRAPSQRDAATLNGTTCHGRDSAVNGGGPPKLGGLDVQVADSRTGGALAQVQRGHAATPGRRPRRLRPDELRGPMCAPGHQQAGPVQEERAFVLPREQHQHWKGASRCLGAPRRGAARAEEGVHRRLQREATAATPFGSQEADAPGGAVLGVPFRRQRRAPADGAPARRPRREFGEEGGAQAQVQRQRRGSGRLLRAGRHL